MPKCKICGEKEDLIYWLFKYFRCVHCHLGIDAIENPRPPDKEWDRRAEISKKAVKEYMERNI